MKQPSYNHENDLRNRAQETLEDESTNLQPSSDLQTVSTSQPSYSGNVSYEGKLYAATHTILEFWGADHLCDVDVLEASLKEAALAADATVLHIHMHQFSGEGGVTGVALLAESHISVHTWPEHDYAAFDIFMCGNSQPDKAVDVLKRVFQPSKIDLKIIPRGEINT